MARRLLIALPRFVLLACIVLVATAAILAFAAPAELLCSTRQPAAAICRVVAVGAPDWLEHFGAWFGYTVLCPIVGGACWGRMQLSGTQSAFQALFGFAIILDLVIKISKRCQDAFDGLPDAMTTMIEDASDQLNLDAASNRAKIKGRLRLWIPLYSSLIWVTFRLIHYSYLLTAAVAGFVLIGTFVTEPQRLSFGMPQAVVFALGPFIAVLLMHLDLFVVERVIPRSLAPGIYWNRYWGTAYVESLTDLAAGPSPSRVLPFVLRRISAWLRRWRASPPAPPTAAA